MVILSISTYQSLSCLKTGAHKKHGACTYVRALEVILPWSNEKLTLIFHENNLYKIIGLK